MASGANRFADDYFGSDRCYFRIPGDWLDRPANKAKTIPCFSSSTFFKEEIDLPPNLPAPVCRFFQTAIGESIPVIESAVASGSGKLRMAGLIFPSRFLFIYHAGYGYRYIIEATFLGYPVVRVDEQYNDGDIS